MIKSGLKKQVNSCEAATVQGNKQATFDLLHLSIEASPAKGIDRLEKRQRRATKMMEGLEGYSYLDRLRILGLTTFETRFVRADLIEVYKIVNGLDSLDPGSFFVRDVGVTTGHSFELFKKRVSLDVGRYKFGNRVCNEWNLLTQDVVSAESLNTFKAQLDHHLRNVRGLFRHLCFLPLLPSMSCLGWKDVKR